MFIKVANLQDFISLNQQAFQIKLYCLFSADHYEYMQRPIFDYDEMVGVTRHLNRSKPNLVWIVERAFLLQFKITQK
jgi:hypothetical protein